MHMVLTVETLEVEVEVTDAAPAKATQARPKPKRQVKNKVKPKPLTDHTLEELKALLPGEYLDRLLEEQRNGYAKPFPEPWSKNSDFVGEHLVELGKMWGHPLVQMEAGTWCIHNRYGEPAGFSEPIEIMSKSLPHAAALARLIACWQRLKISGGQNVQA